MKELKEKIDSHIVKHWNAKAITPEIGLEHWLFIQEISNELTQEETKMEHKYCHCDNCTKSICENGTIHLSDCAVHNEPAERNGECNCKKLSIPLLDAMAEFCYHFPESAEIHKEYLSRSNK